MSELKSAPVEPPLLEPLTVVAIACNEAENAAEWAEHLSFADRVVVVDAGSRDGTGDILREAGVHVEPWDVDGRVLIHEGKNRAIRCVERGWILDLDLDERVSLPLVEELESLRRQPPSAAAYGIPFRHYVFGRWLEHGGWCDRHLRLFRAGKVSYPEDRAHSTPVIDGEIGALEEAIFHFAHPSLHEFVVKMNRYTSEDSPRILEHGRGGLRNRPPLPESPLRWTRGALSVFWNRYVKAAGFRDGVPGFLVAALLASYFHVEQAKVWERKHHAFADEESA